MGATQHGRHLPLHHSAVGLLLVAVELRQHRADFTWVNQANNLSDYYLKVAFTTGAGSLAAGATSNELQLRVYSQGAGNQNETGDWSYDPTKTTSTLWDHISLRQSGEVIWGSDPVSWFRDFFSRNPRRIPPPLAPIPAPETPT